MTDALLEIQNLNVAYKARSAFTQVLHGVSLKLGAEKLGIVGESGSGKSTIGRAIMGLLPPTSKISADSMRFDGTDLLTLSEKKHQTLRGNRMAMILQDPRHSLNPMVKVGDQVAEAFRIHLRASRSQAVKKALEMFESVEIRDPQRVFNQYPHEISGGMGQRVMIAMMLVCNPSLLIADEPTSALDASVKASVMATIERLVAERGMGLILISHDLRQVSRSCDRVMIFYRGRLMEELEASRLEDARHPYTRSLLDAVPTVHNRRERLPSLIRSAEWEGA